MLWRTLLFTVEYLYDIVSRPPSAFFCVCDLARRFTFQVAFWDALKTLDEGAARRAGSLACLTAHLVIRKQLSLTVLKVQTVAVTTMMLHLAERALLSLVRSPPVSFEAALYMECGRLDTWFVVTIRGRPFRLCLFVACTCGASGKCCT